MTHDSLQSSVPSPQAQPGHTPGPWEVGKDLAKLLSDRYVVLSRDGTPVAQDMTLADANLLAAAPELLAAAEEILYCFRFSTSASGPFAKLRAVVAGAKGGRQ